MSNWDEFIYFGEDPKALRRKVYLNFCLQCGNDENIRGARYKLQEVAQQALLLDASSRDECKYCRFPVFSSGNYRQLTKLHPLPRVSG